MDNQQRWYAEEIELRQQVIADVGANVGKLSQFFWDAGQGSNKVYSIEPLPQNIKRLKTRIARSKARHWSVLPFAVSDHSGELRLARFHSQQQGWNSAALTADEPSPSSANTKEVVVQCRPLSELVANANVVKLDIEGHEYTVLDQALQRLPDVHTWAVEFHMVPGRPLQQPIAQFEENGYAVIAASQRRGDPSGRLLSLPIDSNLGWEQIPPALVRADGSEFKMLHVIARRKR